MSTNEEPFPGYKFDLAASQRADSAQDKVRTAILKICDDTLFETEPQLIVTTLSSLMIVSKT